MHGSRTWLTYAALMVLTALTLGLSRIPMGELNTVIAMLIAAAKCVLIAMFFMHLVEHKPVNALLIGGALLLLAIFMTFTALDVATR